MTTTTATGDEGRRACDDGVVDAQRQHLIKTIAWARRIRSELQPLLEAHGDRAHFRPASDGIALVGLLPHRPQRGRSGIRDLTGLRVRFEETFKVFCSDVEQGRSTPEKALQSFLIRDARANRRRMEGLNRASRLTNAAVELLFVTDELALPDEAGGRMVCDVLALRIDGGRCRPIVLELKSTRAMARLTEQVVGYAAVVDRQADLFAELFGAVLGSAVSFNGPCERWIVWPSAGDDADPREADFATSGVRVVGYQPAGDGFTFRVGSEP